MVCLIVLTMRMIEFIYLPWAGFNSTIGRPVASALTDGVLHRDTSNWNHNSSDFAFLDSEQRRALRMRHPCRPLAGSTPMQPNCRNNAHRSRKRRCARAKSPPASAGLRGLCYNCVPPHQGRTNDVMCGAGVHAARTASSV